MICSPSFPACCLGSQGPGAQSGLATASPALSLNGQCLAEWPPGQHSLTPCWMGSGQALTPAWPGPKLLSVGVRGIRLPRAASAGWAPPVQMGRRCSVAPLGSGGWVALVARAGLAWWAPFTLCILPLGTHLPVMGTRKPCYATVVHMLCIVTQAWCLPPLSAKQWQMRMGS